jgi:antitoxin HicB
MAMRENPHYGSTLDSFLELEGILEHTQAVAIKRVIAYQLQDILKQQNLTQADLACKMQTSKAAINRLLNPNNTSSI